MGKSIILASPMACGTYLLVQISLISLCVISTAAAPPACMASALMLSGPVALFLASYLIVLRISSFEGGCVGGVVVWCSSGVPWC